MIVLGTQIFKKEIRKYVNNVKKELRKSLRDNAKDVRKNVESTVPVDTGKLKNSLKVRSLKRSRRRFGSRTVFGDAFYGTFLEFGYEKNGRKYEPLHFLKEAGEKERENAHRDAIVAVQRAANSFRGRK